MESSPNQKSCIVCGYHHFKKLYQDTLLQCDLCGFITANLEVSEEALKEIYNQNYFDGAEYADYLGDKEIIQKNFDYRFQKIEKIIAPNKIENVVEIGCAYGFFGELVAKRNIPYKGYDVSAEAVEYAKSVLSLNAESVDYLATTNSGASDIFMWDVIEHLSHPDKFLEKISQELVSGGRVHITTGDIGALLPRLQKEKWRMIHPPSHLHYFSRGTLTRFLKKYGLEVMHYSYPPIYRSVRQIFYSLFILNSSKAGLFRSIYNAIPSSLYVPINTRDIIYIIAEKKS